MKGSMVEDRAESAWDEAGRSRSKETSFRVSRDKKYRISTACLWLFSILALVVVAVATSVHAGESDPFCDLPVSAETAAIRKAFLEGDLRLMRKLLDKADKDEPANMAMQLGLNVFQIDLLDTLSIFMHDHDFLGGELRAFVRNGKPNPVEAIKRAALSIVEENPKAAPHVADALWLAVALQINTAIAKDKPVAFCDDILFSTEHTSAPPREIGSDNPPCEVICSTPAARKEHWLPIRMALLQKLKDLSKAGYFIGGAWLLVKELAMEIDKQSIDRWSPVYLQVAEQCSKKARYASGAYIAVSGAGQGFDGACDYLLRATDSQRNEPNARHQTNLKIAFAYLCEKHRRTGGKFPKEEDAAFAKLRKTLASMGDPDLTNMPSRWPKVHPNHETLALNAVRRS